MFSPVTAKPRTSFAYAMLAVLFLSPLVPVAHAGKVSETNMPPSKIIASLDFDPEVDGFGFPNYGRKERDGSRDLAAPDLIRTFGTKAVCKNAGATVSNCVMKASAREWMAEVLEAMGGGHCEGMAVACLRFNKKMPFKGRTKPGDFQRGVQNPFDLKLDPAIANYIAYYWMTQALDEIETIQEDFRKKGPVKIVETLIQALNAGNETYTIGLCQRTRNDCEKGHAITPFAVEDAGAQYKIHVYDNNFEGETRFMTVQKGGRQAWKYTTTTNPNEPLDDYAGNLSTKSLEIVPTSKREGQCFWAPFDEAEPTMTGCGVETPKPVSVNPGPSPKPIATPVKPAAPSPVKPAAPSPVPQKRVRYADFFLTGDGEMMIIDGKDRRLGYDPEKDDYFDEIPGGKRQSLAGGMGVDMPHYKIPHDPDGDPYVVVFSGDNIDEESVMDFVFTGPGFTVGFDGIRLDPGEFLVAGFSPDGEKISMEMSKDGEMPEVYYSVDTPKKSYIAEVRGSQPVGASAGQGRNRPVASGRPLSFYPSRSRNKSQKNPPSMTIDFKDANRLQISDNIEGDSNYDIDIEQFDAAGKTDRIELNDVGKGDGGADAYEIEIGKWDGGKKIAVKHDDEGNGFADDDEVLDDDEENEIPDDPGGLVAYLFQSLW